MDQENTKKRDFGSFHSSNVEELIYQNDIDYKPPILNIEFDLADPIYAGLKDLKDLFGSQRIKKELFYLSDEFTFLNHGAFGLSFKPIIDYVNQWRAYAESQPLRFYDRQIMPLLVYIIRLYAQQVFKCKPWELCLVENCTFAFNSLINSMALGPGHEVFIFSTTYGVYKKILKLKCLETGAKLIEQSIEFPIKDEKDLFDKTVQKLTEALNSSDKLKLVLVDSIPSNQPFLMPVSQMAEIVKSQQNDILFVVDGAHSLGSIKSIDLTNIDIFFTNCHKWFGGPKGTAFMYKNENITSSKLNLRPAVLSHGINSGFNSEFIWTGLRDYSSYLGLYASLNMWHKCLGGFEHVISYCTELARSAGYYLKHEWNTDFLVSPLARCSTMLCVRLPDIFVENILALKQKQNNSDENKLSYDQAEVIQNFLYFSYKIEVPIKCVDGKLYVRISSHVYNNMDDYKQLCNVVLENSIQYDIK